MNPAFTTLHRMAPAIPLIEIADNADTHGIRSPYSKTDPFNPANTHRMRSQHLIDFVMDSCLEFFYIFFRNRCRKSIGIPALYNMTIPISHLIHIIRYIRIRQNLCKIFRIHRFHHHRFPAFHKNLTAYCPRKISLHKHTIFHLMRSQNLFRAVMLRINNRLNLRPLHISK